MSAGTEVPSIHEIRTGGARMKIVNKTKWHTPDLRRIAARVVRAELPTAKYGNRAAHFTLYIGYNRGGPSGNTSCSGWAQYRSNSATVNVSSAGVDPVDFAKVVAHELGHCKGLKHGEMPWHMGDSTGVRTEYQRKYFAWAKAIPVRETPKKVKVKPSVDDKIRHAQTMLAKATTRVKRAVTIQKKWARTLRDLQRRGLKIANVAAERPRA
jgi:hypothetical protein